MSSAWNIGRPRSVIDNKKDKDKDENINFIDGIELELMNYRLLET